MAWTSFSSSSRPPNSQSFCSLPLNGDVKRWLSLVYLLIYLIWSMSVHDAHMEIEDNLWDSVLSFHHRELNSGLAASTFTYWAISLAHKSVTKKTCLHIIWEFKSSCNIDFFFFFEEKNAIKDFPLWKCLNFSLIKEYLALKLIKIRLKEPGVLACAFNPSIREAEAGLVYIASAKTARATHIWLIHLSLTLTQ